MISRTFNRVCHEDLISNLEAFGLQSVLQKWIEDYLRDGSTSGAKAIDVGAPQESILGPLLFIIYIDDLPQRLTNTAILYADDSSMSSYIRDS